jgi:hypothetical protein
LAKVESSVAHNIYATSSKTNVQRKHNTTTTKSFADRSLRSFVTTAYLEPIDLIWLDQKPLPPRNTSASMLTAVTFPQVTCVQDRVENFPIDDYPTEDPFLPWIHDYFPTRNGSYIQFVAQNRRRCNSGRDHVATMKFWEPQVSLFQSVPVDVVAKEDFDTTEGRPTSPSPRYKLGRSPDTATFSETRFICRFHNHRGQEATTFSMFNFNYEYITWRHQIPTMLAITGSDANNIWLSQLLFRCPVPLMFQEDIQKGQHVLLDKSDPRDKWVSQLWVDLVPIRTPTRHGAVLFTERHVGPKYLPTTEIYQTKEAWGNNHVLPAISDSGRWANLPICLLPRAQSKLSSWNNQLLPNKLTSSASPAKSKPFHLVACTWTAASYTRRGDAVAVSDSARRLREWIVFHLLVGFDHLYIYDNTQNQQPSPLHSIAMEYKDHVTYHPWPCKVCNNNRPNHPNSGERSSQYAAEASCRERYGPMTEWMAFIDTDEYLVPLAPQANNNTTSVPTWHDLLYRMEANHTQILKLRSSRAKPRYDLME